MIGNKELRAVKLIFDDNTHPSAYATNITVQHTPHEFVISFYEARPPLLVGTPEEVAAHVEAIDHIFAPCVSRVTVAAARMEGFIKALEENYENFRRSFLEPEIDND